MPERHQQLHPLYLTDAEIDAIGDGLQKAVIVTPHEGETWRRGDYIEVHNGLGRAVLLYVTHVTSPPNHPPTTPQLLASFTISSKAMNA